MGNFALPALIFGSLCKLTLSEVNWTFLLAILVAKGILFAAVFFISLVAIRELRRSAAIQTPVFSSFVAKRVEIMSDRDIIHFTVAHFCIYGMDRSCSLQRHKKVSH